jgi:hypothetical protein
MKKKTDKKKQPVRVKDLNTKKDPKGGMRPQVRPL